MTLVGLINLVFNVFYVALLVRIVLSFVIPMLEGRPHPIVMTVADLSMKVTEPVLAPIRRVLPTFGMMDFSPMAAIILMWAIQRFVISPLLG